MSKKSGLFYRMLSAMGLAGGLLEPIPELKYEDERKESRSNRHRFKTFGKEITSYGTKPDYGHLKRKPFYQAKVDDRHKKHQALVWELREKGIIWTAVGLFWKDRKLAELNN